jgi:serine protease Do
VVYNIICCENGPADKAGIQQGDVIMEFDRKEIVDSKDLPRVVAAIPVGKSVTVRLSRNGNTTTKDLKVGEMEEKTIETAKALSGKKLGIGTQDITPEIARALSLRDTNGAVVTQVEPGSTTANTGIQRGDVIREVNRKAVRDSRRFIQSIEEAQGDNILLLIQLGENNLYLTVSTG